MKKYILIIPIVVLFSLKIYGDELYGMYYLDLALRPGVNVASTLEEYEVSNTSPSPTLGVELGVNLGYLTIGGGIHYNNQLDFSDASKGVDGSIRNMPIYIMGRFNLFPIIFKPYVVYKYGINRVEDYSGFGGATIDHGDYWAVGLGIDVYNFLGELTYQNSTMDIGSHSETLSQLQLTIGVKIF